MILIFFLLVVCLFILAFMPEQKVIVEDKAEVNLPIVDSVPQFKLRGLKKVTSFETTYRVRLSRPVSEEPQLPATKLRGKVMHSKFCRHLDEKRLSVVRKYGVTKGHKRPYRFDRQDERAFKQSQHDFLYSNIETDSVELCDMDDTLNKIWG